MKDLLIVSAIILSFPFGLWIWYKWREYQEDKRFWKSVDMMIAKQDKEFSEAWIKAMGKSAPFIIDYLRKRKVNVK